MEERSANHRSGCQEILEEMRMGELAKIEKFTPTDLATLRGELMNFKMDSWQAADVVSSFLAGRGYGVNASAMRTALPHLAILGDSHEAMQSVLENVAYVM
jgi:hypothetical protein